jgi:hypothetical protein
MREVVSARGHPNIRASHLTTFEITKEKNLTKKGDCIIGVNANKSVAEISDKIKEKLRKNVIAKVELLLPQYGLKDVVVGYGNAAMPFNHPTDIVIRKSSFVCGKTLLIKADKAAKDIDREIVELLRDPSTELLFIIRI